MPKSPRKLLIALPAKKLLLAFLFIGQLFFQTAHAKHVMIFGDSLSAAYGLEIEQGWVSLLADHWAGEHQITNASISGETTVGGLARLPLTLEKVNPDVVVLELGANDGLRGYPVAGIRANLEEMIGIIQDSGASVAIAGISLPATYGPRYIDQFRAVFSDLANELSLPFIDLYREDFVSRPDYIQADGLHPTAITQPIIRDTLIKFFDQHQLLK